MVLTNRKRLRQARPPQIEAEARSMFSTRDMESRVVNRDLIASRRATQCIRNISMNNVYRNPRGSIDETYTNRLNSNTISRCPLSPSERAKPPFFHDASAPRLLLCCCSRQHRNWQTIQGQTDASSRPIATPSSCSAVGAEGIIPTRQTNSP